MLKRILTILAISLILALAPMTAWAQTGSEPAAAFENQQELPGGKITGSIFGKIVTAKPIAANNAPRIPGGTGYPWGQPGLQWATARMEGVARTGITNVSASLYLRARLNSLKRDGASLSFLGGGFVDGWYYGTTYIQAIGYVFGVVYGHTWRAETGHAVTDFGGYDWNTTLSVQTTL